jgi:hypothetical protein
MNNKEFLQNLASLCPKQTNLREVLERDTIEPVATPKKKKTENEEKSEKSDEKGFLDSVYDNTIGAYVDYFGRERNSETESDVERRNALDDAIGRNERITDQIISQFKAGTISKDQMKQQIKDATSGLKDYNASLQSDANFKLGEKIGNTMRDVAVTGLYFTPGAPIAAGLDALGAGTDAAKAGGYLDTYMSPEEAIDRAKSQALGVATFGAFKAAKPLSALASKTPVVAKTMEIASAATPRIVKGAASKIASVASKANKALPYDPAGGAVGAIAAAQTIEPDDSFIKALAKVAIGGYLGGKAVGGLGKAMPSLKTPVSFGAKADKLGASWERTKVNIADTLASVPKNTQAGLAATALALTPHTAGPVATPAVASMRGTQTSSVLAGAESRGIAKAASTPAADAAPTRAAAADAAPTRAAAERAPTRAAATTAAPDRAADRAVDRTADVSVEKTRIVAPDIAQDIAMRNGDPQIAYANYSSQAGEGRGEPEGKKGEGKKGEGRPKGRPGPSSDDEGKVRSNVDPSGGVGLGKSTFANFSDYDKAVLMQLNPNAKASPEQVQGNFYIRNTRNRMSPTLSTEQFTLKNKINALIEQGRLVRGRLN